jgi:hypothetical protein
METLPSNIWMRNIYANYNLRMGAPHLNSIQVEDSNRG